MKGSLENIPFQFASIYQIAREQK